MGKALLYIRQQEPPFVAPLENCRNLILEIIPNCSEVISYGVPFYSYRSKNICYLTVIKKKAILGLVFGALIDDPFFILEGEQKQVRHLDRVKHGQNHDSIRYYLMESIKVNKGLNF